jgi:hypothetical protein
MKTPINDYKLYNIEIVENNHQLFVNQCLGMHQALTNSLNFVDTTRSYWQYNFFSLSSSSLAFYKLLKEIVVNVREYVGDDRPLWMSGWINCHRHHEVLDWHNHMLSIVHGYVCIDPKDTETEFEDYSIKNKIGQMYLGPSERLHRVVNKGHYSDHRITIGFDISDRQNVDHINSNFYSFIPIF